MTETNNKVMTLKAFLADYAICRVWQCGVSSPAGQELILDTEADGEDYCDSAMLLELREVKEAAKLEGEVTEDIDGEMRWEVISLVDTDLRDDMGNTIYNLTVWGQK